MKRNQLKRIIRQISEAELAISEIPVDLQEAIAKNNELDCLHTMNNLSKITDSLSVLLDNGYASRIIAESDNPGKAIWFDGYKTFIP